MERLAKHRTGASLANRDSAKATVIADYIIGTSLGVISENYPLTDTTAVLREWVRRRENKLVAVAVLRQLRTRRVA